MKNLIQDIKTAVIELLEELKEILENQEDVK